MDRIMMILIVRKKMIEYLQELSFKIKLSAI